MNGPEPRARPTLVSVREASEGDAPVLDQHLSAAREESERYRGSIMAAAGSEETAPRAELRLVAEVDGRHVASLVAAETEPGTWMVLWVHTAAGARTVGAGDALMDRFRTVAAERGARRLLSRALPGDRETKNLFERHGFTAQMIVLGASVADPSATG